MYQCTPPWLRGIHTHTPPATLHPARRQLQLHTPVPHMIRPRHHQKYILPGHHQYTLHRIVRHVTVSHHRPPTPDECPHAIPPPIPVAPVPVLHNIQHLDGGGAP